MDILREFEQSVLIFFLYVLVMLFGIFIFLHREIFIESIEKIVLLIKKKLKREGLISEQTNIESQIKPKKTGADTHKEKRSWLLKILIGDKPIDIKKIYHEIALIEIKITMHNKLIEVNDSDYTNLKKEASIKEKIQFEESQLQLRTAILDFEEEIRGLKKPLAVERMYVLNHLRIWIFTLFGYGLFIPIISKILKLFEIKENSLLITSAIILFHFIVSWFNVVNKKERGSVYFFEKPLYNVGRGLHFVPWFVCTLDKEQRTYFEDELPANPEKIYRVERGEQDTVPIELVKEGFKPPLRIMFRGLTKDELEKRSQYREEGTDVDDPLEERVTVEVPGIVIWRIVDLIVFRQTIGDVTEAQRQMGDVFVLMMTTELSKITLREFLKSKEIYDENLKVKLAELTKSWGIEIITAGTKEYIMSRGLNILLQGMAEAKAKKRSDALAGKGKGDEEEAILVGRTKGLLYMAEELKVKPESVLSMESVRDIANKVNNLVLAGGTGGYTDLIGMVAAGAAALPPKKENPKKNSEGKELDEGGKS